MQLNKILIGEDIEQTIVAILRRFHTDGPVSLENLMFLSLIKKVHPKVFSYYEKDIIYLLGLFYKVNKPENVTQLSYQIMADLILEKTGYHFTPVQASIYKNIQDKKNFSFSAPTSSGKSFLFREVIDKVKGDIVIVLPSRALIGEYLFLIKEFSINKKDSLGKTILVLDFIENVNKNKTYKRVFIITPERGTELFKYVREFNIELFLFDEAQISEEENIRGLIFDSFVRKVNRYFPYAKKVFAHPFIQNPEAQFTKHKIKDSTKSYVYNFNSVGKIFLCQGEKGLSLFSPFEAQPLITQWFVQDLVEKENTFLIYLSKAKIYNKSFINDFSFLIDSYPEIESSEALAIINSLKDYIGAENSGVKKSFMINLMKYGIVIHHGSIPLKARFLIENFVNQGFARICFATSTLIQGINMPFDVVWIDNYRFSGNEENKALALKNLIGRSGRSTSYNQNVFDYGYVVVKEQNVKGFSKRLKQTCCLDTVSLLDKIDEDDDFNEYSKAIKEDTFNEEFNLPQVQVRRLNTDTVIKLINSLLDLLFTNDEILKGTEYNSLPSFKKQKIKHYFQEIYRAHLSRTLTEGEVSVLSTAISILLWRVQSKTFKEIVSLRYSYITKQSIQDEIKQSIKKGEITEEEGNQKIERMECYYSPRAESLPNKKLNKSVNVFRGMTVKSINYDLLVYDTYDYLDKVISFSLADPLCAALELYFKDKEDSRAAYLSQMIRYGTTDTIEIWLLKYGFDFEDIELIKPFVLDINANQIYFDSSVNSLNEELKKKIEPYL